MLPLSKILFLLEYFLYLGIDKNLCLFSGISALKFNDITLIKRAMQIKTKVTLQLTK